MDTMKNKEVKIVLNSINSINYINEETTKLRDRKMNKYIMLKSYS